MDGDTVSPQPTYLPFLPYHILYSISTYLDERSTWRAMATCQALREAAEKALKWHLREMTILGDPPVLSSIFEPMNHQIALLDDDRRQTLLNESYSASQVLSGYAPAGQLLRSLKVELKSKDEGVGFEVLKGWASQLERLEIHMLDLVVDLPIRTEVDEDGAVWYVDGVYSASDEWTSEFSRGLGVQCENLTCLVLAATARTLGHFDLLAQHIPNLRDLTLSAHRLDYPDPNYIPDDPEYTPQYGPYPNLESLTVSGDGMNVATILCSIIYLSHQSIRYLIIHINQPSYPNEEVWAVLCIIISYCKGLHGLGIYGGVETGDQGGLGVEIMLGLKQYDVLDTRPFFPNLATLVLEGWGHFPIVNQQSTDWLNFPHLKRITYVDRTVCLQDLDQLDDPTLLDDDSLSDYPKELVTPLFLHYDKLDTLQFVNDYPIDPFIDPPRFTSGSCTIVREPSSGEAIALHYDSYL